MSPFINFIIIALVHASCLQGTSSLVIKGGACSRSKLSTARHASTIVSSHPHIVSSQRSLPLFPLQTSIKSHLSNLQGNINYQDRDYTGERTDSVVVSPNLRQGIHDFTYCFHLLTCSFDVNNCGWTNRFLPMSEGWSYMVCKQNIGQNGSCRISSQTK